MSLTPETIRVPWMSARVTHHPGPAGKACDWAGRILLSTAPRRRQHEWTGIALIALAGGAPLGGIPTHKEKVIDAGPIEVSADKHDGCRCRRWWAACCSWRGSHSSRSAAERGIRPGRHPRPRRNASSARTRLTASSRPTSDSTSNRPRTHRLARDADARRVDEGPAFTPRRPPSPRSDASAVPSSNCESAERQRRARRRDGRDPACPGVLDGRRVVFDAVAQKRLELRDQVLEPPHAREQESDDTLEPRGARAFERCVPQSRGFEGGTKACDDLRGRHSRDVLRVHPLEFLGIEHGIAAADPLERKCRDQFLPREDLLVGARRPSEQREEVDHRVGQVTLSRVLGDARRTMPLAQTLPVGAEDERHVAELGCRDAERLEQQHVLRRVRDVIVPAHHVRDGHVEIVGDHRQVVCGMAIRAQDDEVLDVRVFEADGPVHEIGEARRPVRNAKADRARCAGRLELRDLLRRE